MTFFKRSALFLFLLVMVLTLSGCMGRSPEARFFLLPADQSQAERAGAMEPGAAPRAVGIVLQEFPAYLDQPQIVTRAGNHQLEFAELHRWSQSLREAFLSGLTERLRMRLEPGSVWAAPFPPYARPDRRVVLDLFRLDGSLGDEAFLETRWVLLGGSEDRVLAVRRSSLREPVAGPGYEDLVAAEGRLVSLLADEIAAVVKSMR